MADITIHSENNKTVTCVPNIFIDELMADADGEFVKIYLYLLRCMNAPEQSLSISSMADKFEHTEKDIKRALKYWEKAQVLHLEYNDEKQLTGICLSDTSQFGISGKQTTASDSSLSETSKELNRKSQPVSADTLTVSEKPDYSIDDMQAFQADKNVQELLFMTETYLGRTLTATDITSILSWYDGLKFQMDLIEYLVEYCVEKNHKSLHYIEKVALSWHEAGIHTVSAAKEANAHYSRTNSAVKKAFGISGRQLVENELNYIAKWTNQYGFSVELIVEACKRTMQNTHQPSFEYTDSILKNWKTKKVSSLEEIAALDAAFLNQKPKTNSSKPKTASTANNKFNNFPQRSYDYDQLEKQAQALRHSL